MGHPLYYGGIGSRAAPRPVMAKMIHLATNLMHDGFTLRSGHADGSDMAFEIGAQGCAQIFLPWEGFNGPVTQNGETEIYTQPTLDAYNMAAGVHPAWSRLSSSVQALHARNCHQILGPELDSPVEFVLCWTPEGKTVGGTATAIKLAERHGIPVWNLAKQEHMELADAWLCGRI